MGIGSLRTERVLAAAGQDDHGHQPAGRARPRAHAAGPAGPQDRDPPAQRGGAHGHPQDPRKQDPEARGCRLRGGPAPGRAGAAGCAAQLLRHSAGPATFSGQSCAGPPASLPASCSGRVQGSARGAQAIVKLAENFNGADLRNVCTEAGMFAIRDERDYVVQEDFMKAVRKLNDAKKLESSHTYDSRCARSAAAGRALPPHAPGLSGRVCPALGTAARRERGTHSGRAGLGGGGGAKPCRPGLSERDGVCSTLWDSLRSRAGSLEACSLSTFPATRGCRADQSLAACTHCQAQSGTRHSHQTPARYWLPSSRSASRAG